MKQNAGPLLSLVGVLAGTVLAVAIFRVPQDSPVTESTVETTLAPSEESESDEQHELAASLPDLTVVGSGERVDQLLGGVEFEFFTETGLAAEVLVLGSPGMVWELTTDNRNRADVIEIGFRLDALSGRANAELLPLDPSQIPRLAQVDDRFSIDTHGIVPLIDGALGLVSSGAPSVEVSDWADLQAALDGGAAVVVPAPPIDLTVVFVWALGDGDPELGLTRYASLIEGGAVAVRTTGDFIDFVTSGPSVGAWSSSGVVRAQRTSPDVEFLVPTGGAVALPGFAGILAETDQPEAAHRWLDFRLGMGPQEAMTFGQVGRRFDQVPLVPPVPVIDLHRDTRAITAFDPHAGDAFVVMDWTAVAASATEVTAALEEIVGAEG